MEEQSEARSRWSGIIMLGLAAGIVNGIEHYLHVVGRAEFEGVIAAFLAPIEWLLIGGALALMVVQIVRATRP